MGEAKRKRMLNQDTPKPSLALSMQDPDSCMHLIGEGATVNIPFNRKEMLRLKLVENIPELITGIGSALITHDYRLLPLAAMMYLKQTQTFEHACRAFEGKEAHFLTTFFWSGNKGFLARPCGVVSIWNEDVIHQAWEGTKSMFNPIQYHPQSRVHHLLRNGIDSDTVAALLKDYFTHIAKDGEVSVVSVDTGRA